MIVHARFYASAHIKSGYSWGQLVSIATTIDLARAKSARGKYSEFAEDISGGFGVTLVLTTSNDQRLTFKAFPEGICTDSGAVWFEAWMGDARNVRRALGRTAERWIDNVDDRHPLGLVSIVRVTGGLQGCLALVSGRKEGDDYGEAFSMPSSGIKGFANS